MHEWMRKNTSKRTYLCLSRARNFKTFSSWGWSLRPAKVFEPSLKLNVVYLKWTQGLNARLFAAL